jgi:predicted metalloprotease with PDZ domain
LEKIKDIANKFVRVRLAQIESSNLKLFDFDYDLTFMVFFLSPDERVYARYGGRSESGPDERQSLAGLRYTMESVLAEHSSNNQRFAPMQSGKPFYITEIAPARGLGRCIHCHQAKEVIYNKLDREGNWNVDLAFRYPLPDNLGMKLEVDRGNTVEEVVADSSAAKAGLRRGDAIVTLNDVPVHSFGDAQFALDRAPKTGAIEISWRREGGIHRGKLELPDRWRRTDISWRPSLQNLVASARVYGENLTEEEKQTIGLSPKQLAFRQKSSVPPQAHKAGILEGDIIVGVDDRYLEMRAYDFLTYIRCNYVKGEVVTVNAIRNGRPLRLPMKLE